MGAPSRNPVGLAPSPKITTQSNIRTSSDPTSAAPVPKRMPQRNPSKMRPSRSARPPQKEFSLTAYRPGEFVAPERSYGGGIPPEAQALADALRERGEVLNKRTMEGELLGFGGEDAVSSPMARFQALREGELTSGLNNTLLGLLQQSAESGRERRHQAGMQDQDLATQRFLTGESLGTERYLGGNQMRLQDFMQGRDLDSKHYLDSMMRSERYDDREIAARRRNEELLLALMGGPSSATGRSGSVGFGVGLPWG